jgi:hypothetical protein
MLNLSSLIYALYVLVGVLGKKPKALARRADI